VFVGIYWESYGWVAPGETVSGLEDEYNLAPEIPMLIYIKESAQRDPRLEDLLDRIREDDRVSYVTFVGAPELRRLLTSDVATLLAERFELGTGRSSLPEPARAAGATTLIAPPPVLTSLIGRETELSILTQMLIDDGRRLVTVTGPGGVGKTRLALAAAREMEARFDGVAFVDLAPLRDPALVLDAIASAVGVVDSGRTPLSAQLQAALGDRRMLLVLDNAEQVVDAAPVIARLASSTAASVLVTSRTLLRVNGEQHLALGSLPSSAAIELFAERARAVRPDFEISDSNGTHVAEICQAVDSMPLAIELAAARVRVLRPSEIADRLQRTLPLLVEGARDRPERQRTLRATIDWSAELLRSDQHALLLRLGVFRSGFALEAAEWINGDQAGSSTLDLLTALIDGSLVQEHDRGNRTWFTMLATVREYARDNLAALGESAQCSERHAQYYIRLAAIAGAEIIGSQQEAWASRLVDENNELTAAVEYLLDSRRWDDAVTLVWSLDWFWGITGRLVEVSSWMQRVLDDGIEASERARTIARVEVVFIGVWRNPDRASIGPLTECANYFRTHGDGRSEAKALVGIAWVHIYSSPPDFDAAEEYLQQALDLVESLDDPYLAAGVRVMIGHARILQGNLPGAVKILDAFLADSGGTGDSLLTGSILNARGWVAILAGDLNRAEECFRQQLLIASAIGHEQGVAYALEGFFATAAAVGDLERGGELLGAAETIRQRKGNADAAKMSLHAPVLRDIEATSATLFQQARTAGRALDTAAAVEVALE
jgi:predicted ATPase